MCKGAKDEATRNILQMKVDGKRNRCRPKLRWRDLMKEDMARKQMTNKMAEDRKYCHVMIHAGTLRNAQADRRGVHILHYLPAFIMSSLKRFRWHV